MLRARQRLERAKALLRADYERHVGFVKAAAADGALVAARLLYYPFMRAEYRSERTFELGLAERLRAAKVAAFSVGAAAAAAAGAGADERISYTQIMSENSL